MLTNSRNTYGFVSKFLHWSVALIIIGLLLLGYYLDELSYSANQFTLIKLHKSFGLLILWLVAIRIIWNRINRKPEPLFSHAKWEKLLAKSVHAFLYAAIIGMPLSGWVMSMSGGYPVAFFGIDVPSFISKNSDLNKLSWQIHQILSYALIAGVLLHATGALKHHFFDKDQTLKRMVFRPKKVFIMLVVIMFIVFVGGLIRLLIF